MICFGFKCQVLPVSANYKIHNLNLLGIIHTLFKVLSFIYNSRRNLNIVIFSRILKRTFLSKQMENHKMKITLSLFE